VPYLHIFSPCLPSLCAVPSHIFHMFTIIMCRTFTYFPYVYHYYAPYLHILSVHRRFSHHTGRTTAHVLSLREDPDSLPGKSVCFVVDKLALAQKFLRALQFSSVSMAQMPRIHSSSEGWTWGGGGPVEFVVSQR
jgi:hypothetical protein